MHLQRHAFLHMFRTSLLLGRLCRSYIELNIYAPMRFALPRVFFVMSCDTYLDLSCMALSFTSGCGGHCVSGAVVAPTAGWCAPCTVQSHFSKRQPLRSALCNFMRSENRCRENCVCCKLGKLCWGRPGSGASVHILCQSSPIGSAGAVFMAIRRSPLPAHLWLVRWARFMRRHGAVA